MQLDHGGLGLDGGRTVDLYFVVALGMGARGGKQANRRACNHRQIASNLHLLFRHKASLCIAEEHHETHVHVVLLMTVKQGHPRVVGGELDIDIGSGVDQYNVLDDAASVWVPGEVTNLEAVAMQMDGVVVGTVVFELQ